MKASWAWFGLAAIALVGGGLYLFKRQYGAGAVAGSIISPYANQSNLVQPSQAYPYQAPQPVRNDNQSEPWYGGSRQAMTQVIANTGVDPNFLANVQYAQGLSSMVDSLSSIWDSLGASNWFSDDEIDLGDTNAGQDYISGSDWRELSFFA